MLSWISSIIINFVNGNGRIAVSKKLDCAKVLCINSRGIHLVSSGCEEEKVLHLRNKLLGHRKIRYLRRKMFGSRQPMIRQILKIANIDGELFLSTIR